jgi:hypothetical protein
MKNLIKHNIFTRTYREKKKWDRAERIACQTAPAMVVEPKRINYFLLLFSKHWGLNLDVMRERTIYILTPLLIHLATVVLLTAFKVTSLFWVVCAIPFTAIIWNTVVITHYDIKKKEEEIRNSISE